MPDIHNKMPKYYGVIKAQDFILEDSSNECITDIERQYVQREHTSEYYKSLTEEGKKQYDEALGCMMLLTREMNYSHPPMPDKEFEERLKVEYNISTTVL